MTKWYHDIRPSGEHAPIHSFSRVYAALLDRLCPPPGQSWSVFEWGPGLSTDLAISAGAAVVSVEHDRQWLHPHAPGLLQLYVSPGSARYARLACDRKHDVYFVDGRRRVACLLAAKISIGRGGDGVAVLHDAQRPRYLEGLELFEYGVAFPDGVAAVCRNAVTWGALCAERDIL